MNIELLFNSSENMTPFLITFHHYTFHHYRIHIKLVVINKKFNKK
jgi:hypothetical protein